MDWQTILVALIILGAFVYAGKQVFKKAQSFSGNKNCGSDCGCSGAKQKNGVLPRT